MKNIGIITLLVALSGCILNQSEVEIDEPIAQGIISITGDVNFSDTGVGASSQKTFTISNTGTQSFIVSNITFPSTVYTANWNGGTISAGGSVDVTVTFRPTSLQTYDGVATIVHNAEGGNTTFSITGSGVNNNTSIISLSGDVTFGEVAVGTSTQRTFTISNAGNQSFTVSSIRFPNSVYTADWTGGTINGGTAREVTVTFRPTNEQAYSGTVTVSHTAASGNDTLSISGNGVNNTTSAISLSGNVTFADTKVDSSSQNTFTISNTGNQDFTVSDITFPSNVYTADWTAGTVRAGGSVVVTVTFAPTNAQSYNGIVTVNNNATSGNNTLSISGNGINNTTSTIFLSGDVAFADTEVGSSSQSTFTISNTGNQDFSVVNIDFPSNVYTADWTAGTVRAGGSVMVTVTFAPTNEQAYTGIVTVNNNATSGNNTFSISGNGIINRPIISLSGDVTFADTREGSSSQSTFTIYNTGNQDFYVVNIDYPSNVYTANWTAGTVRAGDSVVVTVTFMPTNEQAYTGTVTIITTSGNNTLSISGNGIDNNIAWTQATSSAGWSERSLHTSVVFDNKIWVIGGYNGGGTGLNDIWSSSDGINWTQETTNAGWTRRQHTSVVFDNKIWVMGGFGGNYLYLNDVWSSSDGINWTQETANAGWSDRNNPTSVVFDNKIWVMGGYDNNNNLNDVWSSSDGINWTQETANAGWTGRTTHASVVFDNKIWVMGGRSGSSSSSHRNDVWSSSDGINWTQETASAGWTKREGHTSVVFDNKIWVMGAFGLNDVWSSSDGINWTRETSSAGWTGRLAHTSVVFDNKLWVIGGNDRRSQNDVWYGN